MDKQKRACTTKSGKTVENPLVNYYYNNANGKNINSNPQNIIRDNKICEIIEGDGTIVEKFNSVVDTYEAYESGNSVDKATKEGFFELFERMCQ